MKRSPFRWVSVLIGTMLIIIAVGILLARNRKTVSAVSLTFQQYNYLDELADHHCAFFRLTNNSDRPLVLTMTGGKNTIEFERPILRNTRHDRPLEASWQVNGAFSDKTSQGWSNWIQQPSTNRASNLYMAVQPHAAITVRLPMPPNGSKRKVAVIYQTGAAAWENCLLPKVMPHLPRWALLRLAKRYSKINEVWADGEFPPDKRQ